MMPRLKGLGFLEICRLEKTHLGLKESYFWSYKMGPVIVSNLLILALVVFFAVWFHYSSKGGLIGK